MTQLKIFGTPRSRTIRTIWLAQELDLPYELISVDLRGSAGKEREGSYSAINPNMRVPAIDDNGFHLWESMAINLYLAKKYAPELYPKAIESEALAWQWTFWAVTELELQMIEWALHDHALPEDQRDAEKAAAAWNSMQSPLRVLDEALSASTYLLGEEFTVADLNVASVMFRAHAMNLDSYQRVKHWFYLCWQRPPAKRARALRGDI